MILQSELGDINEKLNYKKRLNKTTFIWCRVFIGAAEGICVYSMKTLSR